MSKLASILVLFIKKYFTNVIQSRHNLKQIWFVIKSVLEIENVFDFVNRIRLRYWHKTISGEIFVWKNFIKYALEATIRLSKIVDIKRGPFQKSLENTKDLIYYYGMGIFLYIKYSFSKSSALLLLNFINTNYNF